jgi:hypothetical protein
MNKAQYILMCTLIVFAILLMFVQIPDKNEKFIYLLLGALITAFTANFKSNDTISK